VNDERVAIVQSKHLMLSLAVDRGNALAPRPPGMGGGKSFPQRRMYGADGGDGFSEGGASEGTRGSFDFGKLRHDGRCNQSTKISGFPLLLPAICTRLRLQAEPPRTLEPAMPQLHLQIEAGSPTRGAKHTQHMTNATNVLLLQNSEANPEIIVRELRGAGMEVHPAVADNAESVKSALGQFEPDVVLTDYVPGSFGACEVLDVLRYESPETPLIVITESVTGAAAVACLRNGAEDIVITKNVRRLPSAIAAAIERRSPLAKLTSRQIEILRLVAEGRRTREIAEQLQLSVKTVESHRGEVMKRLGMHDVVSLVRYALRVGLVSVAP